MTKANRDHPVAMDFATAIDRACGRMVHLGLEQEAMVELARELAFMLFNDSFKPAAESTVPHSAALARLMFSVQKYLEGENSSLPAAVAATLTVRDSTAVPTEHLA
ncbi:MAG TPA: hypothetical protein VJO34_14215 [Methylomirabilota bacterium]|nr:hypothetical protein [Methylomirabilota bacterium]